MRHLMHGEFYIKRKRNQFGISVSVCVRTMPMDKDMKQKKYVFLKRKLQWGARAELNRRRQDHNLELYH